ncbi:hypothetical protein DFH07DRAFT_702974, partial [Mycena maculata]
DRTEFIWLDEFCLADLRLPDKHPDVDKQRSTELGRLADIFRRAARVSVFCQYENCDHTGLQCPWGARLFTFPEILNAQNVLRITKKGEEGNMFWEMSETSGRAFREEMQTNAARGSRWHLYAIFQHTVNSGAVPWQVAIHALVVEAIRCDERSGFDEHKYLGRILNGLLPRRARLGDFGSNGWNDLAWILELNQGFYNAASLAAVCSVAENQSVSWLGKPIDPAPGNERLEPVVTAFPVSSSSRNERNPPLSIIGGETLGLRPTLKRDKYGLYNNKEIRALKLLS